MGISEIGQAVGRSTVHVFGGPSIAKVFRVPESFHLLEGFVEGFSFRQFVFRIIPSEDDVTLPFRRGLQVRHSGAVPGIYYGDSIGNRPRGRTFVIGKVVGGLDFIDVHAHDGGAVPETHVCDQGVGQGLSVAADGESGQVLCYQGSAFGFHRPFQVHGFHAIDLMAEDTGRVAGVFVGGVHFQDNRDLHGGYLYVGVQIEQALFPVPMDHAFSVEVQVERLGFAGGQRPLVFFHADPFDGLGHVVDGAEVRALLSHSGDGRCDEKAEPAREIFGGAEEAGHYSGFHGSVFWRDVLRMLVGDEVTSGEIGRIERKFVDAEVFALHAAFRLFVVPGHPKHRLLVRDGIYRDVVDPFV